MKRLVVDVDLTLTLPGDQDYSNKFPNIPFIEKLRLYKDQGFEIVIFSARNMRTYDGNIGKINKFTLPVLIEWLNQNNVPFDEIIMGKPWCGTDGFYIDDKAIRPSEFLDLSYDQINELINS